MSLLERIAQRAPPDAGGSSLPDILAETALLSLLNNRTPNAAPLVARHFAETVLDGSLLAADIFVGRLLEHGISVERIICGYIPEAARHLGAQWASDEIDFAQVTQGCGHLLRLTHDLGWQPPVSNGYIGNRPRALLLRPSGEDHFLGLLVAAYQLRHAGWLVKLDLTANPTEISETLSRENFDVIGVSAGHPRTGDAVAATLDLIRPLKGSALCVLGGTMTELDPEMSRSLDVDLVITPDQNIPNSLQKTLMLPAF